MNKSFLIIILISLSSCSNTPHSNGASKENKLKIGHSLGCYQSDFIDPNSSEYVLPYEIGASYTVSQSVCGGVTHVKDYGPLKIDNRYSIDFDLPVGAKIVAARGGEVINVEDFYSNETNKIEEINFIFIRHSDKTVAVYFHLSPKGALVNVGDKVEQGDTIAISGNSGFSWVPHLHFDVRKQTNNCKLEKSNWNGSLLKSFQYCPTLPVAFKNAAPLDAPLEEGQEYIAAEY